MDASALVGKWLLSDPFLAAGAVAREGEPRGQWLAEGVGSLALTLASCVT